MNDLRVVTQFSVFLVNKPGILAQVTSALAERKINIVAMTLVDSQEHGVLRFVAGNSQAAQQVVKQLNLPMTETDVLAVELSNRPGALADVAALLGRNHININYAYVTSGAPGGRTTAILKVADLNKAQRILADSGAKHHEANVRRFMTRR
jgi:hypothetical protein